MKNEELLVKYIKEENENEKLKVRNIIIENNMGLIYKEIKKIFKKHPNQPFSEGDLLTPGVFGLLKAIEHFDPKRGQKFSTLATLSIRQAVNKEKTKITGYRYGVKYNHMVQIHKLINIENEFTSKNGRKPTEDEMFTLSGMTAKTFVTLYPYLNETDISLDQDKPYVSESGVTPTYHDYIPSDQPSVEEEVRHMELKESIMKLNEKEKNVIIDHFFGGLTYREMAKKYGKSKSEIQRRLEKGKSELKTLLS